VDIQAAELLREKSVSVMGAVMDLSEPANAVFGTISPAAAIPLIEERHAAVNAILFDVSADGRKLIKPEDTAALAKIEATKRKTIEEAFMAIAKLSNEMRTESLNAANAINRNDKPSAGESMERSDTAFVQALGVLKQIFKELDGHNLGVLGASADEIKNATYIQYIIAALILVLVSFVMAYAHFVGRVLAKKFNELEQAHADSEKFGEKLRGINHEIGTLQQSHMNCATPWEPCGPRRISSNANSRARGWALNFSWSASTAESCAVTVSSPSYWIFLGQNRL
jgi:hypothetical protein